MNLVNEGVLPPDELDDRDERREEQERARSRETVADIVADIRERAENAMRNGERLVHNEAVANMLTFVADRIEAVWKRDEERAVEHATRHAEAVARDNCRDCVHNPNGKNYKGGNEAAMREALVSVHALIADEPDGTPMIDAMKATIEAALSLPPRNCDKMPDIDNLTMHDLAKSPCKSTLEYAFREELLALVRWPLAPAAERKGDGDGSK